MFKVLLSYIQGTSYSLVSNYSPHFKCNISHLIPHPYTANFENCHPHLNNGEEGGRDIQTVKTE